MVESLSITVPLGELDVAPLFQIPLPLFLEEVVVDPDAGAGWRGEPLRLPGSGSESETLNKGVRDTDEERFGSRVLHYLAERPFWLWGGGGCVLGGAIWLGFWWSCISEYVWRWLGEMMVVVVVWCIDGR